jgi:hypothetical protein
MLAAMLPLVVGPLSPADPVAEWLEQLTLTLPNFTLPALNGDVTLDGIECTPLSLREARVDSEEPLRLSVQVAGVGAGECRGSWREAKAAQGGLRLGGGLSFGLDVVSNLNAVVTVKVSKHPSLLGRFSTEIHTKSPTDVNISAISWQCAPGTDKKRCEAKLESLSLETGLLRTALNGLGDVLLPQLLRAIFADGLDSFDRQAGPFLPPLPLPLLAQQQQQQPRQQPARQQERRSAAAAAAAAQEGPPITAPAAAGAGPPPVLQWDSFRYLWLVDYLVNDFLGPTCSATRPHSWCGAQLARADGALALPTGLLAALPRLPLPLPLGAGEAVVTVGSATVRGLLTAEPEVSVLLPAPHNTLHTLLAQRSHSGGNLSLTARATVSIALNQSADALLRGPSLRLPLHLGLALPEPRLAFDLQLGISQPGARALNLNQLTTPGCLLPLLRSAGLPSLSLNYSSSREDEATLSIRTAAQQQHACPPAGCLTSQLVADVEAFVALLAALYGVSNTTLVSAAVAGPLRGALDGLLAQVAADERDRSGFAATQSCPSQPSPFTADTSPSLPLWVVAGAMPAAVLTIALGLSARIYLDGRAAHLRPLRQRLRSASLAGQVEGQRGSGGGTVAPLHSIQGTPPPPSDRQPSARAAPPPVPGAGEGAPLSDDRHGLPEGRAALGAERSRGVHAAFGAALSVAAALRIWTVVGPLAGIRLELDLGPRGGTVVADSPCASSPCAGSHTVCVHDDSAPGGWYCAAASGGPDPLLNGTLELFSCPQMVHDFWEAGAYILTILIFSGSIIFPLVKQLILLRVWVAPWRGAPASRSALLRALHMLGRSAFAAEFFLGYVVCLFYVHVAEGPMSLKIAGEPRAAIYGGLASTGLCAVLSHLLILEVDKRQLSSPAAAAAAGSGGSQDRRWFYAGLDGAAVAVPIGATWPVTHHGHDQNNSGVTEISLRFAMIATIATMLMPMPRSRWEGGGPARQCAGRGRGRGSLAR